MKDLYKVFFTYWETPKQEIYLPSYKGGIMDISVLTSDGLDEVEWESIEEQIRATLTLYHKKNFYITGMVRVDTLHHYYARRDED